MSCTRRPGPPGAVTWTRTADCVAETAVFGQLANDSADFLLCLSWAEHQHQKPSLPAVPSGLASERRAHPEVGVGRRRARPG